MIRLITIVTLSVSACKKEEPRQEITKAKEAAPAASSSSTQDIEKAKASAASAKSNQFALKGPDGIEIDPGEYAKREVIDTGALAALRSASVVQQHRIEVTHLGYSPDKVRAEAEKPITLIFTRTAKTHCGEEIQIKDYNIKKKLPLNKPISVTFTPKGTGNITFACGMDMMKGSIEVIAP